MAHDMNGTAAEEKLRSTRFKEELAVKKLKLRADVGKNLQEIRCAQNITLEELSAKTAVRVQYLQKIEAGQAPGLTILTVARIAGALGATAAVAVRERED